MGTRTVFYKEGSAAIGSRPAAADQSEPHGSSTAYREEHPEACLPSAEPACPLSWPGGETQAFVSTRYLRAI